MRLSSIDKLLVNQTITANGNSSSFKGQWTDQLIAYIDVTSVSAGDTITFTVQSSPDNSNWYDLGSGAAISAVGRQVVRETNFGTYFRIKWVVAGSDVSIVVNLSLQLKGE
jgi:hypothetical protein